MNVVKVFVPPPLPDEVEPHVVALLGHLLETARQTLLAQDTAGLRPSHFRLLSHVPTRGTTISALAAALHMTKQGVGQFVVHLERTGHLEVLTDAQDRRRRLVARTALGTGAVEQMNRTVAALEQHWEQQVGAETYGEFRVVLAQLAGVTRTRS